MMAVLLLTSGSASCRNDCCPEPPAGLSTAPARVVRLDGAENTRDLGGYLGADGKSTRWRTVFRSAALASLTPEGCQAFAGLRVRTVIDFRNRLSASSWFGGDVACVQCCAEVILLPVKGTEDGSYASAFLANRDAFRQGLLLLADPQRLPVLFHCGGGVDRAGIFAALLLKALGVSREDIVADYLLSSGAGKHPAAIGHFLDFVDQQGGVEALLASLDIRPEVLAAIRSNLLE
jgi:protein-tyrosine phosphatase